MERWKSVVRMRRHAPPRPPAAPQPLPLPRLTHRPPPARVAHTRAFMTPTGPLYVGTRFRKQSGKNLAEVTFALTFISIQMIFPVFGEQRLKSSPPRIFS
ncbi:hypothetical protein EVAR_91459_1 [Eumeta japonica]|uniref:Uncharacterized protein n=1 Tax=Eumeta variegata TaxID=151549 RepID=A0A4C1X3D7_EUMVA|nr:hypothetical protein EVAR_91459_1 [Eumeta japonica]